MFNCWQGVGLPHCVALHPSSFLGMALLQGLGECHMHRVAVGLYLVAQFSSARFSLSKLYG